MKLYIFGYDTVLASVFVNLPKNSSSLVKKTITFSIQIHIHWIHISTFKIMFLPTVGSLEIEKSP